MAVLVLAAQIKDVARYPNVPIVADSLDFAFTAPSVAADGIQIPITGRELILVQNADAGTQTFTIASARDEYGRLGDITTYSMAAGEFAWVPLGAIKLFGNNGSVLIVMSNANVKVAVLRTDRILA